MNTQPIDLWAHIRDLFDVRHQGYDAEPEIDIHNLPAEAVQHLVRELLARSEFVGTSFQRADFPMQVDAGSPHTAALALSTGKIVGAIWLKLRTMPEIGLYFDAAQRLSIAYTPSADWTPIALLALFNLLVEIQAQAKQTIIELNDTFFTPDEKTRFDHALEHYAPSA